MKLLLDFFFTHSPSRALKGFPEPSAHGRHRIGVRMEAGTRSHTIELDAKEIYRIHTTVQPVSLIHQYLRMYFITYDFHENVTCSQNSLLTLIPTNTVIARQEKFLLKTLQKPLLFPGHHLFPIDFRQPLIHHPVLKCHTR